MSEKYNRTLLWSGALASSCTLSEPVTNFEYFEVVKHNTAQSQLFPTNISANIYTIDVPSNYVNAGYLSVPNKFHLSENQQGLSSVSFNFFYQTNSSNPRLLGQTNSANNRKLFGAIYGVNRISGTETTAIGVPCTGAGWRPYDETVLWSASGYGYSSITLSEPASAFERIRIKMGTFADGYSIREYTSPSSDNNFLTTNSYFGNTDSAMNLVMNKHVWTSGTMVLSSTNYGKSFAFGVSASNPYTGSGNTADSHWIRRNIVEVVGINRK